MSQMDNGRLDDAEIRRFSEQGFLLLRQALPPAAFEPIKEVIEHAVDHKAHEWLAEGKITGLHEDLPFEKRYAALRAEYPATAPITWKRLVASRALYDLWQRPELLGALRSLLGDEIYAHGVWNTRPREPQQPVQSIDWHQDAHYYPDFDPADGRLVTAWMPLVPVDAHSGCLQVAPGSHKLGFIPPVRVERNNLIGVDPAVLEDRETFTAVMEPGDVLLFDALMLHRALDNVSDYVRWSVDIRYGQATEAIVAKGSRGYLCASASRDVDGFEDWIAKYDKPELEVSDEAARVTGWDREQIESF